MMFYRWIDVTDKYTVFNFKLVMRAVDIKNELIILSEITNRINNIVICIEYRADPSFSWSYRDVESIDEGKIFLAKFLKKNYIEATEKQLNLL